MSTLALHSYGDLCMLTETLESKVGLLLKNVKTLAIVCNQWGDTGKGKFVDFFGHYWHADIIARGTGGANAGHTIKVDGRTHTLHLLPSGICGEQNIIGNDVVFDPVEALKELNGLEEDGVSYRLLISHQAHLALPQHFVIERLREMLAGSSKIGTTGRGIGEVYGDHVVRCGLVVNDLLNPDIFREKLEKNLKMKRLLLRGFDHNVVQEIVREVSLKNCIPYDEKDIFNADAIIEVYTKHGKELKAMITDTDNFIRQSLGKKRIILEGAQGHLLSVDYGTYPFVTSSDCSLKGLSKGVGLHESNVDRVFGIARLPYMTRVGEGAFPTELGGERSRAWCNTHKRNDEDIEYPDATINDNDEFRQGVAVRRKGGEYGATTGRLRRVGWTDAVLLEYAALTNGPYVIFTKADIMNEAEHIKICDAYIYTGPTYFIGNKMIASGSVLNSLPSADNNLLRHCTPVYKQYPGWQQDISSVKLYADLPVNLRNIVEQTAKRAGVIPVVISVGPDRNETIVKP